MNVIKSSIFFCITLLCVFTVLAILHACTMSFHNISMHGNIKEFEDKDTETSLQVVPKVKPSK